MRAVGRRKLGVGQVAEVGGVTAGTLVGRVQELGVGRMWHCWGQVGSYRILHMGDTGGESTVSLAEGWSGMSQGAWCGLAGSTRSTTEQDGAGLCLAITTQFHFASSLASGPCPGGQGKCTFAHARGKKENEK